MSANEASPPAAPPPIDLDRLRRLAQRGVLALASRTVVLQLLVLGGNVALVRMLDARDFGQFAIVQFALAFFTFFGDSGVGGGLVRKKEEPTERELSSVFWLQVSSACVLFGLVMLAAPILPRLWHSIGNESVWLLRVLAFDLVLTSARVVPAISMERRMQYGRLAVLEVVMQLSFYLSALGFAFAGMRAWALAAGALGQAAAALVAAFVLSPWRPRWLFDWPLVKPLMAFGLKQQARGVIGFINGAITPVYAGATLGPTAVGYVQFAQNTAYFPLKLVDILSRVSFPLYSKLQDDRAVLGETLGRCIQLAATLTLFWVGLCFGIGEPLVQYLFAPKWLPALPLLLIFAGAITIGFLSPLVAVALDATGRPGVFARLALFWTALNWTVVLVCTPRWHMNGFVGGYVVHVVVGNALVLYVASRFFSGVRFFRRVLPGLVAGVALAVLGRLGAASWIGGPWSLAAVVGAAAILFFGIVLLLDRRGLFEAIAIMPGATPKPAAPKDQPPSDPGAAGTSAPPPADDAPARASRAVDTKV